MSVKAVFWHKVSKTKTCWNWLGRVNDQGYGRLAWDNRKILVHRFSWELHKGPVPEGLCVLHRCDNPCCVNPEHLFLGTRKQNNHDRDLKGRTAKLLGEQNGSAKLTPAQVKRIRLWLKQGLSQREVAREAQVSQRTVCQIHRRERWAHI